MYVHIPFCASRCPYCDFATAPATSTLRERYVATLRDEIAREGAALGRPRVRTLFFGGGTPSLLEPGEIDALASSLRAAFDLRPREVTIEANPATLDRARLGAWRAAGVTRISIGAQTFQAAGLRALGRTHAPEDIAPAVAAARSIGADVNLDLIFGWTGQTEADWRADLDAALALGPEHLSAYPLELALEPDGSVPNWPGGGWPVLRRWRADAERARPDDEKVAEWYDMARETLATAGYRHYEISNWARPGKRCLHNLAYWTNAEWLGLGAGAHSHLGGLRSYRPAALVTYLREVANGVPRAQDKAADRASDTAILALRLDSGLALDRYARRFGGDASARVERALRDVDGSLVDWAGSRHVRLSARGQLLANEVFVTLLPGS